MKARLLLDERQPLRADAFVVLRVWAVPEAVRGSVRRYKYSLALAVGGICVLRYDNEAGKGDHKHVGDVEVPYDFRTAAQLIEDFWRDVDRWKPG
jgi:hypothetical protein